MSNRLTRVIAVETLSSTSCTTRIVPQSSMVGVFVFIIMSFKLASESLQKGLMAQG